MKHLIIAVVIGVLTIGLSIFVLSDKDSSYEGDAEVPRENELGESFSEDNYDLATKSFDCDLYSDGKNAEKHGCVLLVELTNTTIFEQLLNLDGDKAISASGDEYPSSDADSRQFIPDNGLTREVEVGETVSGGVFFNVPADEEIVTVEIYESAIAEPIVISL